MERRLTFRSRFSAATSHHDGEDAKLHGHAYDVEVEVAAGDWALGDDLDSILAELDGRRLEDMMPGASTDLDQIPGWLLERLVMSHPAIVEVRVTEIGRRSVTASLIRPQRAPLRA